MEAKREAEHLAPSQQRLRVRRFEELFETSISSFEQEMVVPDTTARLPQPESLVPDTQEQQLTHEPKIELDTSAAAAFGGCGGETMDQDEQEVTNAKELPVAQLAGKHTQAQHEVDPNTIAPLNEMTEASEAQSKKEMPPLENKIVDSSEAEAKPDLKAEIKLEPVPVLESQPALQSKPEVAKNNDTAATPNTPEPPPIVTQPKEEKLPLLSWLCGEDDLPPNLDTDDNDPTDCTIFSASNLEFTNLDGMDCAFYMGKDRCSVSYMRFQPLQQCGIKLNKSNSLTFVALHGKFDFEYGRQVTDELHKFTLTSGDLLEIKKDTFYKITNRLNEAGILLMRRK